MSLGKTVTEVIVIMAQEDSLHWTGIVIKGRRKPMSEGSFQSRVLSYLNSIEGCCAENVSGNSQQSGRADINGVYRGRSFRIELKILDNQNKPTLKQMLNLMKWFKSGSAISVAYTIADIQKFIEGFKNETPWFQKYDSCAAFGYYRLGEYTNDFFREYKKLYTQN